MADGWMLRDIRKAKAKRKALDERLNVLERESQQMRALLKALASAQVDEALKRLFRDKGFM